MAGSAQEFNVEAAESSTRPARATGDGSRAESGPVPWIALATGLLVLGVLTAPGTGIGERGIIPAGVPTPTEQWSVALHSVQAAEGEVWITDNQVLAASRSAIRAADLATGDIAWEVQADQLRCALQAPRITCVTGLGQRAELIELTTSAGEVERTPAPHLVAAVPHAEGVIELRQEDEQATVTRRDPAGAVLWHHQLSPYSGPIQWTGVQMSVVDDLVLLSQSRQTLPDLAVATLAVQDGTSRQHVLALPKNEGEWLSSADGTLAVYGVQGRPWPIGPAHLSTHPDDEAEAELVFDLTEDALQARSVAADELLWDFIPGESAPVTSHTQPDGALVVWSDGELRGLDPRTGAPRWREPAQEPNCPCSADDRVLTHLTWEDGVHLRGLDVHDGTSLWEIPLGSESSVAYHSNGAHVAVATNFTLSLWQLD